MRKTLFAFQLLLINYFSYGQFGNDFALQKLVPTTAFITAGTLRSNDALQLGNYLYVCYGNGSTSTPKGAINIYDVSTPTSPLLVKELTYTDRSFTEMLLENNTLYIIGIGLSIFDVTTVTNPIQLAFHLSLTPLSGSPYTINQSNIDKSGSYLFWGGGGGVGVYTMASLTSQPVQKSTRSQAGSGYRGVAVPNSSTVVSFDDYKAYYSNFNNGLLTADVNVETPGWPVSINYQPSLGLVFISSDPALGGHASLSVLNVNSRQVAGEFDISATIDYPGKVAYSNGVAMIKSAFSNTFMTVNVSNLAAMALIKKYTGNNTLSTSSCFRFFDQSGLLIVGVGREFEIHKAGGVTPSPAPTITSFTPTSGPIGATVTITGTNFSTIAANNMVKVNGTVAIITATPTSTSITITVPTGAITGTITVTVGGQTATSATNFTILSSAPAITGFTPTSGSIGAAVTITGSNFSATPASNVVKFNSTNAVVTGSTATTITTNVPVGATTGAITVTVGGQTATSATNFTLSTATHTITGFAPVSGPIGAQVTITGTNFSATPASNLVKFNNTNAVVTASTATTITTTVPVGAATGPIIVTIGGQPATSATSFTISTAAHTITSFAPTSGLSGTPVTITGTNFSNTPANNTVRFNNTSAVVTGSTATTITTTVPLGATTGAITVTVGGQTATSATNFDVTAPAPVISGFTPSSGQVGTPVTISGTNFSAIPDNNAVNFNNTLAQVTASTATSITAIVPAGATNGTITVTIGTHTATSAANFIIPAPTITSFTPTSGQVGTPVTITGTNFSIVPGSNNVKFNNTATIVTASTSTSITTTVPAGATTGTITVEIGAQTASSAASFTVPAPTITSFTPTSGQVGTPVTITGTNFSIVPGSNVVKFNNAPAAVTASTATSMTTTVPAGAATGTITVTIGTHTATSAAGFTVPAPSITSFTPTSAQIGGVVTITGANFSLEPASNIVKFNGTTAPVTTSTSTSITTAVPAGATNGTITVTIGAQTATSATSFTIPAPTITSFTPTTGQIGEPVTITGMNFSLVPASNVVKFSNTTAIVTTSTATSITTIVPNNASTGPITVTVGTQIATGTPSFIVPAPTITGFTPASAKVGNQVTISGTNFSVVPSSNVVKFGSIAAAVTASTPGSITTTVPVGATTGIITVTIGLQSATSAAGFLVTSPSITSFNPTTGAPGSTVIIAGANFSTTSANNIVKVNGSIAAITGSPTVTTITITIPQGATTGKLTVEVNGDVATSSTDFTVVACAKPPKPTITATNLGTVTPILTSSSATGNQWFLNGSAIANATGESLNVTAAGVYKTQVTVAAGCLSDFSNDFAIVVTGDINSPKPIEPTYYPNPVENRLIVETFHAGLKSMRLFHADGKQIHQLQFESASVEVDVCSYPAGMYYFIVTSMNGTSSGKFVKR